MLLLIIKGIVRYSIAGIIFYRSILGIIILLPYVFFFIRQEKEKLYRQQKERLMLGFRDGIQCILAALEAGYSMENAIEEAIKDLSMMYQEESEIQKEFVFINRQVKNNIPIEKAMEQFAIRSNLEDIKNFAEIIKTAKRTGGDVIKIIRTTTRSMSDKLDVKREIQTLVTAKQFDLTILKGIPFGIILYLGIFSPGFLSPLYHNAFGIVFMSFVLVLYLSLCRLAEHIVKIEV